MPTRPLLVLKCSSLAVLPIVVLATGCSIHTPPMTDPDPADPGALITAASAYHPSLMSEDATAPTSSGSAADMQAGTPTGPVPHVHEAAEPAMQHTGHVEHADPSEPMQGMQEMQDREVVYACPMHPDITGAEGERCTKCGMAFVPRKQKEPPR